MSPYRGERVDTFDTLIPSVPLIPLIPSVRHVGCKGCKGIKVSKVSLLALGPKVSLSCIYDTHSQRNDGEGNTPGKTILYHMGV